MSVVMLTLVGFNGAATSYLVRAETCLTDALAKWRPHKRALTLVSIETLEDRWHVNLFDGHGNLLRL